MAMRWGALAFSLVGAVACAPGSSFTQTSRQRPAIAATPPEPAAETTAAPAVEVTSTLAPQSGHVSQVWAVAFSPDGRHVATGGFDHTIGIWSLDGRRWATLIGHREALRSVAWRTDGRELVSSARDGRVIVWDLARSEPRLVIEHGAFKVAWSPDQLTLATAGPDTTLRLWSAKDGRLLSSLETPHGAGRQLLSVAFSPSGRELLAGSLDGHVQVWDVAKREPLASVKVGSMIWNVAWSPDGTRYAVASGSGVDVVERLGASSERRLGVASTSLSQVAWTKDGHVLSAGDGQLFVFDAATGKTVSKIPAGIVESLAVSPDSTLVATGGDDAQVRVWGLSAGAPRAALGAARWGAHSAIFSPDASRVVTGGGGGIYVWDAGAGGVLARFGGERDDLDAPTLSPDGRWLAAVDQRSASVWEVETKQRRFVAPAPRQTGDPPFARFSVDARRLAIASGGKVAIWDVVRKRIERTLDLGQRESSVPEWSADTRLLAVRSGSAVVLFDTKTWKRHGKLEASKVVGWGRVAASSFSPDGRKLLLATDQHLGVFDVASGALESTIAGRGLYAAPRFSPDGRFIAYATRDRAVAVWDGRSPVPGTLLEGPKLGVRVIAWSPDGRRIAASSDEGTVWVWDVARRALDFEWSGHEGRVWSLAWHPKGEVLLSASHHARLLRLRDGVVITFRPAAGLTAGLAHAQSGLYAGDEGARAVLALRVGADLGSSRLLPAPSEWHSPSLLSDFWAGKPIPTTISAPASP